MLENPLILIAVFITLVVLGFWLYQKAFRKKVDRQIAPLTDFKKKFKAYLRSEQWRNLKSLAVERASYKCELCGQPYKAVHHVKYPKRYEDDHLDNLVVICDQCHAKLHGIRKEEARKEIEKLHLEQIPTPTRNYFFEVKRTVNGDKYLTITEYKKTGRDSSQRHRVMVFEEDFERFAAGLTEALTFLRGGTVQESTA